MNGNEVLGNKNRKKAEDGNSNKIDLNDSRLKNPKLKYNIKRVKPNEDKIRKSSPLKKDFNINLIETKNEI